MNNQLPQRYTTRRYSASLPLETRAAQILAALLTGAIVYIVLLLVITLAYRVMYAGKIFPGVSIEGIALDGLPVSEAADKLRENITYPVDGKITFQYKDQVWTALPTEVGLYLDVETSAVQAYRYGRQENLLQRPFMQFKALISGAELPAQFIFDEQTAVRYLQNIAAQIDKPTREASLSIEGVNVLATPGQIGYALDIPATIASLYPPLQNLEDGIVPLVVKESPPDIMDVSAQAEKARQIISSSLVLQLADSPKGDAGPWTLSPEQVAQMLNIV